MPPHRRTGAALGRRQRASWASSCIFFWQHDGVIAPVEPERPERYQRALLPHSRQTTPTLMPCVPYTREPSRSLGNPDIFYSEAAMAGIMLDIKAKIEDASLVGGQMPVAHG